MRETTYREFFNGCAIEHDESCGAGAACPNREHHIIIAYMPHAMANEIDMLRAAIGELEEEADQ